MEWLRENWFSVLIFILFVGMHLFGHGKHDERARGKRGYAEKRSSQTLIYGLR
ncbi:MAG: DUF2933 domain-containing protein [Nitrospirae bacterium]|nr:DUF2933 domain-containing protein [Nitrospirota bacterium]